MAKLFLLASAMLLGAASHAAPYKVKDLRNQSDSDGNNYEISLCARPSPATAGLPGHAFVVYRVASADGGRNWFLAVGHTTHASPTQALLTYSGWLSGGVSGGLEEERYTAVKQNCLVLLVNKDPFNAALDRARDFLGGQLPSAPDRRATLLRYTLGVEDCVTFVSRVGSNFAPLGLTVPVRGAVELPLTYIRRVIESN